MSDGSLNLMRSDNPLMLFHESWVHHVLRPLLQSQEQMREQNFQRELKIITELVNARQQALRKRDLRFGLSAA